MSSEGYVDKQRQFIIDVADLLRDDPYWKEYVSIKDLKYESMKEYFTKVIQPQIYYRTNEGLHYRDFEAWVMTRCWSRSYHYNSEHYLDLVKTIMFFIEDYKKHYPWTWRIHVFRYPFIGILHRFYNLNEKR